MKLYGAPFLLGAGVAIGACGNTANRGPDDAQADGGADTGTGGAQSNAGTQNDGGAAPELCTEQARWAAKGVDPAELFPGTGAAQLSYPDGTQVVLERELRCEVLRNAQGAVVGYLAGFADSLPTIGHRAAVLVESGYAGDGTYDAEGKAEGASVQLVLWISGEPCLPRAGCWSGTYAAQVTLQDDGRIGTATTADGLTLEFGCSENADLALGRGEVISLTAPAPGTAYMERASGFVLPFVGIECSTDEVTGLLSVHTQPMPWSDPNDYDRGYGFSIKYQEPATTDPRTSLGVQLAYDYFGTVVVGGATADAMLACGSPLAGAIQRDTILEDPKFVGAWFQCP